MPISALDIKVRKSQRLTDNPDGGGRMVAAEVVDGELNNLFPDISTQDRVSGRVSMRKAFVHVDTPSTEVLYGAVGVIVDPPADASVNVTMFSTGSYADTRADARNRIENYTTKGVESNYVLFGDHFIGQRSVRVYCMKDAPTPEVNQTYCLSVERDGYTPSVQFLRVEEVVSRTTQLFYDSSTEGGAFERDVIVFTTTTALIYDFPGQEVFWRSAVKPPTRVRHTNVSDASNYYGVRALAAPVAAGALTVKVDSPFVPLVPTTQAETAVVDVLAGMGTLAMVQAGPADSLTLSFTSAFSAGVPVTRYLGSPFTRGEVKVVVGGTTLTDDGRGTLEAAGGNSAWGGSVDYAAGSVAVTHSAGANSTGVSITATPAAPVLEQGFTGRIEIGEQNRQLNYVMQLTPLPYAGTVVVDYMALGKWIRLTDNGTGRLAGAPGQGSGTVNYQTGSVIVTLGALPDLDSALIVGWGTGIQADRRDGSIGTVLPAAIITLPGTSTRPGTVAVEFMLNGVLQTATDAAGDGNLRVGSTVVGLVDYAANQALLMPPKMPDANSAVVAESSMSTEQSEIFTPALDSFGTANIELGGAVAPGSVTLAWSGTQISGRTPTGNTTALVQIKVRDDGNGNLVSTVIGSKPWTQQLGTIDYELGLIAVKVSGNNPGDIGVPVYSYTNAWIGIKGISTNSSYNVTGQGPMSGIINVPSGSPVIVRWQSEQAEEEPGEVVIPPTETPVLVMDLTQGTNDPIVPGSVRFEYAGRTYVDRNGSIYHSISPTSGSGTYAGTIDYATGAVNLVAWERGQANSILVKSLLIRYNEAGRDHVDFRTPGAPLRPGSFVLRATTLSGDLLTATADFNGNITGDQLTGSIDWQSGAATVRFGKMVTAAGNENEPWFDPEFVVNGQIWRPTLINPNSVYFGTVVYRNIPLNPAILGLDPVRLPGDGRVLIFRPGQTVLVHHTNVTEVASPTAGQLIDFGRPQLSRVEVRDSIGTPIDPIWFTVDRAAGTLTFSATLNLTAYTLPVVIRDRIEDRVLVADARITGEIEINRALAHDYPDGGYLSTCLILGEQNGSQDLQARVENVFDQSTWMGVFSDLRIGSGTDAQYNDVNYPILVDNGNAITERWAIHFTNATSFEVIGETTGIIAIGTTSQSCAPLNPRTGEPYFVIPKEGWGTGWSAGNVVRFNTIGAIGPVWFIRTTLAGEMEQPTDAFRFETLGDANP